MVRLRPERFVAGGEVLARDEGGRVVFVRGALPGEDVAVELSDEKKDWARGIATEVYEAAPSRVVPPCPRRLDGCGGCDWQHLAVPDQLTAKSEIVIDALRRTGKLTDPDVTLGAAVASHAYRTTIRVVGADDGRASYRAERSHDTVSASGCLIAHPGLVSMLDDLVIPTAVEVTLRVSSATGERTARWDTSAGEVRGLPDDVRVGPDATVTEEVAGHRLRVSAGSFFQSGPQAAELLVDAVTRFAPELASAGHALDAYGGIGLFAVAAVPPTCKVTLVETSRSSVADAEFNLDGRDARVERSEFGRWRLDRGEALDVAIADPARSGLGRPGVAAVAATETPVLVLVSCDPVALARDTALLHRQGYRHDGTEVLDLFPHTHHVEAVTRFVRS